MSIGQGFGNTSELQTQVKQLEAENAALKAQLAGRIQMQELRASQVLQLREQLAAVQKDAERYRQRYETLRALFSSSCPSELELDTAIDSAIAKEKGHE